MSTVDQLPLAVRLAAKRPDVVAAVNRLYDEAATEIQALQPVCHASGRCCHFEQFGHRLYVTTAELAAFYCALRSEPEALVLLHQKDGESCRFQHDRLCKVHLTRPLGCRLFYCDPTKESDLCRLHERLHARLKRLHERMEIPYFYIEWREGLTALADCR